MSQKTDALDVPLHLLDRESLENLARAYETDLEILRPLLPLAKEIERARGLHPTPNNLFEALLEEVGEVAFELSDRGTLPKMRTEAIQVACVAMRLALDPWAGLDPQDSFVVKARTLGAEARAFLENRARLWRGKV